MASIYRDSEGNLYKVMPGIGMDAYKARKHKIGDAGGYGWKCITSPALPWRRDPDQAEADLEAYAAKHNLQKIREE